MVQKSEEPLRALVVGGSLAGLTSALALARGGARVTVLERTAGRRSGAALAVEPDALQAVIGTEAADTVLDRLAGPGHEPHGAQSVAWEDLRDGLLRAVRADPHVTLLEGRAAEAVDQDDWGVRIRTDDGVEHRADVLVGADGHRSIVRAHVAPERPDAAFAGYLLWVGVAREQDLDLRGPWPAALDIQSSGDHLLLGYPLPGPDGSLRPGTRRLGWAWYDAWHNDLLASTGAVRGGVVRHSVRAAEVPESILDELRARARDEWSGPWAAAIADSAARRAITATPVAEYVPDRMALGAAALVGNAAHVPTPMTGSGFAASLEGAAALAEALRGAEPRGVPGALRGYEHRRLGPARRLVESGQGFSRSFANGRA